MTTEHEAALESLTAADVPQRLDAARYLEKNARPEDAVTLRGKAQTEPDELVARVLRRAITKAESLRVGAAPATNTHNDLLARERARAIRDATGMFLHEMTPLIGQLEVVAARLLPDFEGGPLQAEVERVRETLAAFEDLRSAAHSDDLVEFNLTDVVTTVVQEESRAFTRVELSAASTGAVASHADEEPFATEAGPRRIEATVARDDPVITLGSPRLIRLVLANAVRNAFEACETVVDERGARVVISWGATDLDAWVSVVDDGPGLHPGLGSPWEVGTTTKKAGSHRGLGLVIVDQAVESMDGRVDLVDGEVGGCHFEVRWPTTRAPS